jgi:hypothetical protein
MQVLKKITVKAVHGEIKLTRIMQHQEATGQPLPLMTIVGIADRLITRRSAFATEVDEGVSIGFQGNFRAENTEGETFRASVAFLPAIATETLKAALEGEDVENVEFGFAIAAGVSARDSNKYEFVVKSLIDVAIADPLAELATRATKALPAPAKGRAAPNPPPAKKTARKR